MKTKPTTTMKVAIPRLGGVFLLLASSTMPAAADGVTIYQTSRGGDRLSPVKPSAATGSEARLKANPEVTYQTVLGVGGSITEAAAQALSELSKPRAESVIRACFSSEGARYSLTRTHIGSCDFSVTNYSYDPVPGDDELKCFSIDPDRKYLLPVIQQALKAPGADFRILASPWTAPPWMKTNNAWNGGALRRESYPVFARYIARYIEAYHNEGVPVWGVTPENEPLGNGSNWESMHFTPKEMAEFIGGHLGPELAKARSPVTLWAYDQNRDKNLIEWADTLLADETARKYISGFAVHWYQTTRDVGENVLREFAGTHPDVPLLHSEGCVDAMGDDEPVGAWLEDDWYWREEATDWGFVWAPQEDRKDHPKYRPFHRYARDLIGGFNNGLVGWIDWNLALNTRGGPNHARNFCLAPILIDSGHDKVFYTPLYHAISHFSRFVRPGARRIELSSAEGLMSTAFRNPDRSIVVVVFNPSDQRRPYALEGTGVDVHLAIDPQAIQTVVIP